MTKTEPEYWARYFVKYAEIQPTLTFVVKYDDAGAFYTNVSGGPLSAPVRGIKHGIIKHQGSFLERGEEFEHVLKYNKERYVRISEEVYIKALLSGKLYYE